MNFQHEESVVITLNPSNYVRAMLPRLGVLNWIIVILQEGTITPEQISLVLNRSVYIGRMSWNAHRLRRIVLPWRLEPRAVLLYAKEDQDFEIDIFKNYATVEVEFLAGEGTVEICFSQTSHTDFGRREIIDAQRIPQAKR